MPQGRPSVDPLADIRMVAVVLTLVPTVGVPLPDTRELGRLPTIFASATDNKHVFGHAFVQAGGG